MKPEHAFEFGTPSRPQSHFRPFFRMLQRCILMTLLLALTHMAFSSANSHLPPSPQQRTVLSMKWGMDQSLPLTYDMQALEQLPRKEIFTALPPSLGIPGRYRWEGVPIKYLLGLAGNTFPASIRLSALNDYAVEIPAEDIYRYDPILAYRRDGKPMSIRQKGPLIVIYPFDRYPKLLDQQHVDRTIWQVHEITVR